MILFDNKIKLKKNVTTPLKIIIKNLNSLK
jgi:hypothetical protein